jgi:hypothetical protein
MTLDATRANFNAMVFFGYCVSDEIDLSPLVPDCGTKKG